MLNVSFFDSFVCLIYKCNCRPRTGYEAFYFWYGMIFNGTHFVVLCMYASWVYEESFEPISEIASVKHQHLSHEVTKNCINIIYIFKLYILGGSISTSNGWS